MDGKSVTLKFPTQDPKASPKEKFIPILNEILIYTAGEQRRKEVKDETT